MRIGKQLNIIPLVDCCTLMAACRTGGGNKRGAKITIRDGSLHLLFALTTVYTPAPLYYVHWTLEYCRSVLRAPGSDGWSWLYNQWPLLLSHPLIIVFGELGGYSIDRVWSYGLEIHLRQRETHEWVKEEERDLFRLFLLHSSFFLYLSQCMFLLPLIL